MNYTYLCISLYIIFNVQVLNCYPSSGSFRNFGKGNFLGKYPILVAVNTSSTNNTGNSGLGTNNGTLGANSGLNTAGGTINGAGVPVSTGGTAGTSNSNTGGTTGGTTGGLSSQVGNAGTNSGSPTGSGSSSSGDGIFVGTSGVAAINSPQPVVSAVGTPIVTETGGNSAIGVGTVNGSSGNVPNSGVAGSGFSFTPAISQGIGAGYMTLNNGDVVQVSSSNFGVANYYNNEWSKWTFEANQCTLFANCPCADLPPSPFCFDDYLKITDKYNFNQKFCGGTTPDFTPPLQATSDSLTIKFRSNYKITARGFTCFVYCVRSGSATPTIPTAMDICPTFK